MTSGMTPRLRPQQGVSRTLELLKARGVDVSKPALLGMRGYFQDTMGEPGVNDRGLYDDAIFIVTPQEHRSFWANTDPSRYRKGYGTDEDTKGMAELAPGLWKYRRGMHRNSYMALVQADEVLVIRDGRPDYPDRGWFGIHIHKGGWGTTSSLGCQTIHPDQWREFYDMVDRVMDSYDVRTIPYCLIEQQG